MRILLSSDLHGIPEFYDAVAAQALATDAGCVVLAGDLGPEYFGYSHLIESQRHFIQTRFTEFATALRDAGRQLLVILGNHDWACLEPLYQALELDGLLTYAHGRCVPMPGADDYDVIGFNLTTPSRFARKDWERLDRPGDEVEPHAGNLSRADGPFEFEYCAAGPYLESQATLEQEIAALPQPRDWRRTLLVAHNPPSRTLLDRLHSGREIGSKSMRAYIERHQPLVTMHGHIHESPRVSGSFVDRLGESVCFNAGQRTNTKQWHGLWFDLEDPFGTAEHVLMGPARDLDVEFGA